MKVTLFSFALFIALLAVGHAVDVVTPEEKYFDVKVTKVEADGVRITHREGAAFVDFDYLPPALQLESGWTPEKSAARKAAKEAEAKRIVDEERMIADEPKRKAEEAAAKERAIMEKEGAEAMARAKIDGLEAQKDLIAEAAKARAEIDRDRRAAKGGPKEAAVPVAVPIAETPVKVEKTEKTESTKIAARPAISPVGNVAALVEGEKTTVLNRNIAIGLGIASAVVVLLFLLPSSKPKVRVPSGGAGKRR